MARLAWGPDMVVDHGAIDLDHQTLLEALNRLEASAAGDHAAVGEALGFLRDYTVRHFGTEEALMLRHHYPKASSHIGAHTALLMKVSDLQAEHRAGRPVPIPAMVDFLRDWLRNHILGEDQAFGRHLKELGIVS